MTPDHGQAAPYESRNHEADGRQAVDVTPNDQAGQEDPAYAHTDEPTLQAHPAPDDRPTEGLTLHSIISQRDDGASLSNVITRVSTDRYGNTYPEGGLQAWLVVLGSWMGLFGSLGLVNTIGTFQTYVSTHQLAGYSDGTVGWIFGVYACLTFFCGVQIGPVFDAKGPRFLVVGGSILIIVSMVCLPFCTQYWHFMLVLGIVIGIGTSMIFTPAIAAVGHYFYQRRGEATGIAATGGSFGGVAFPLILEALFPRIGFAWATRVIVLLCLLTLGCACILIRSRLPSKPASRQNILPDVRIFRDPIFALTTAGVFLIEWGLFVPITYISSYALVQGFPTSFSYQILAILNVGSIFGRWLPGYFADFLGRFNTMILTILGCLLSCACFWLPAENSKAMLIVYALTFGFFSGSNISLTPVCVGQLCKTENYGRYYATAYTVVSFGTLTGIPIAGEILSRCGGQYWGLITFVVACYFGGLLAFTVAKLVKVGWNRPWVVF
ncbi:uncharacterized protein TRUGW13939_10049 [Talaromyces rugulosus]|uniref:Major facilitator superfamily (MFS) profile domain-containing protein n=1 Tax=Talaromyces rugulosus TaxID=121627 RepID=A0A7H8RAR0_TALRU|nr:uncharacterized protein TRUGW13939_10049 [Talaromyces rugulosus]QKX62881.1 hypothetical protein TRUGW13939_10049 [Talaromyces rugulosus]